MEENRIQNVEKLCAHWQQSSDKDYQVMDKNTALKSARRYVNTVRKKYPVSRALLFGSHAKGNARMDSDIDIALVLHTVDNLFETAIELMQLRSDDDLLIEPHVFREQDFDTDDPLVYEILNSGEELTLK
jgi:predicted nucleotidyltransferase